MKLSCQAILFDLDGTLRHSRPTYSQSFLAIANSLGVPESQQGRIQSQRWLHYYWAQSDEMLSDRQKFDDQQESFWTNHARKKLLAYGCPPAQADELAPLIYQRMADEYEPQAWVPPDVPETLRSLSAAGYRLAVVSNRSQPCQDELDRLGLSEYLDFSLTSGEVHAWKPDPRIFALALQQLELSPEDVLYIGDNYYADVVGARRAGLQPVLIDPAGIFPEVNCPVIASIADLLMLLSQ